MLYRLYLNHCFSHQDQTFDLSGGLTGITGPNESGKSLVVEMIRYALFGTKALRGSAEDYKKLHVELDFSVQGVPYKVVRKGPKSELTGGDHQVSGTKPVNEAIIRIMGYDLTVFDVANVCNQGDVERLTDMRPAERKAMVDQTVGLNVLDEVISFCGERGNAIRREAAAFMSGITEPTPPTEPEDYVCSTEIPLEQASKDKDEFIEMKGFLSSVPEKPKKPKACPVKKTVEELEKISGERDILIRGIHNTDRQIKELVLPQYTAEQLDAEEAQHEALDLWKAKQRLLARGDNECPSCGHTWPLAIDELEAYSEVSEVSPPELTRNQISEQRGFLGNDEKRLSYLARVQELENHLEEIPPVETSINTRRAYEAELRAYEANLAAYQKFNSGVDEKRTRFEELTGAVETYTQLKEKYEISTTYERDLSRYEKDLKVYKSNLEVYETMTASSEAYLTSRKNVADLKVHIKSHLLPSLNKVASVLLTQMTGGERFSVEVDPDFEIQIDGQAVGTLSGSGKAVANLAIRIALGQILTNRKFSVFLADEVDAAMDDERAEYTAEALKRLTDRIEQVIQVTHKSPETDHRIELKK